MSRTFITTTRLLKNFLKSNSLAFLNGKAYGVLVSSRKIYVSRVFFSDKKSKDGVKTSITTGFIASELLQNRGHGGSADDVKSKEEREASWRTMKYSIIFFAVSTICFGSYLVLEFGKPAIGEDGRLVRDEFSKMPIWMQYIYRSLRELDYYKRLIKEPSREKLLPDELMFPYFQPKYTLVLELTDVLVHPDWTYQTGWRFKKRPGIDYFLEALSGSYEIVVYTAEQGMTVFPIIEALDPKNLITYKLVRDATHFVDGHHIKNLDKLNRDLKKVIVVDWNQDSVKFHPENMFHIPRWSGNDDDTTLIDLTAFLITVASSEVEDVRDVLNYYNKFDNGLAMFRQKQRMLLEQEEEAQNQPKPQSPLPARDWSHSFLNKNRTVI